MGQGRLRTRVTGHAYLRDEFAALNVEFNAMAEALQERRAELEKAREAAARSAKAKSEFLANMSHEIRTPMNAILGMTHLVSKTTLAANQKEQVGKIREAAEDLLRLLNNILDFSKIEAGKMPVEHITFQVGRLFTAARAIADTAATAAGVGLVSNISPNIPPQLVGDPSKLAQALGLLLQEAIRLCQGNPVELGCLVEEKNAQQVSLAFTVSVYGVFLDESALAHVNSCLAGHNRGMARLDSAELGLMLAGSVMQLFGGGISAGNLENGFRITGSLALELPESFDQDTSLRFDGERLLLTGGSTSMRAALRELLERYNLRVSEEPDLETGAQMLKQADWQETPFAAVIVELAFDSLDGVAKIEALKHGAGLSHPPLLVLTAPQDCGPPPSEYFEAGLDAYLPRPVNESLLVDSLAGLILARKEHEKAKPKAEREAQSEEMRFDGLRVLLVEDNAVNREIAREVLQNAGVVVLEAVNGLAAVELCDRQIVDFDMVLMDLEMPGMDGLSAAKVIRSKPQHSRWSLPIIAMTAHSGADEVVACFEAGMNDYITKPLVLRDMFAAIGRWLPLKAKDRQECLGVLRKLLGVLGRAHTQDAQIDALLDALRVFVHEGRVQALREMLERQDHNAARVMIRDLLVRNGADDETGKLLLHELDAADAADNADASAGRV